MTTAHPALDWLARRKAGESVALIAHRAGVPAKAVQRATAPYGPFPRATHHLGRTVLDEVTLSARAERWVAARRRGVLAVDIAADEGVIRQYVSQVTSEYGPFPEQARVQEWVAARRAGRAVAQIAAADGVRESVVRQNTAPHGPFPDEPEGPLVQTRASIARRVGMSRLTVAKWYLTGRLPEPDFLTARGRPVWLNHTIDEWLCHDAPDQVCPRCGARCVSVTMHAALAHRTPGPSP